MCDIIDFQSARTAALSRKEEERAESQNRRAARVEWLKENGAPLADQVRAALIAAGAGADCRENRQTLADILQLPFGALPH
jgi:hypothetical protein